MKRVLLWCGILSSCIILLFIFSVACADNHQYFLINQGAYTPETTINDAGHNTVYYTYWYCDCNGGHTEYRPANDPLFPDIFVPHNFSVKVNLGLTTDTSHSYRMKCSVSNDCQHGITLVHDKVEIVDDLGHTPDDVHMYVYKCKEEGCSFIVTQGKQCNEFCNIREYRLKPKTDNE